MMCGMNRLSFLRSFAAMFAGLPLIGRLMASNQRASVKNSASLPPTFTFPSSGKFENITFLNTEIEPSNLQHLAFESDESFWDLIKDGSPEDAAIRTAMFINDVSAAVQKECAKDGAALYSISPRWIHIHGHTPYLRILCRRIPNAWNS